MIPFYIIGIIVLVAAAILIFWFIKKVFKAVLLVLLVLVIIAGITGLLLYRDAMELQEKMASSPSVYLYKHNNQILAGFEHTIEGRRDPLYFGAEALAEINANYLEGNYKQILGPNYRIFVFEKTAFRNVNVVLTEEGEYPRDVVFDIIEAEDAIEFMLDYQQVQASLRGQAKQAMLSTYRSSAELKGMVFGSLLSEAGKDRPLFMIEEYKKGNADIYPETIVFEFIKIMPSSWLEKIVEVG